MTASLTPVPIDDGRQRTIVLVVMLIAIAIDGAAEPATGAILSRAAASFGSDSLETLLKVGFSVAYDLSILASLWLISNHGKRGYFRGSLLGYALACLVAAAAPTPEILVGARVVQGACLGGAFASALLTMVGVSPPQRLPLVFAFFTLVALAAPELAPLLSALVAQSGGWRGVFAALAVAPLVAALVAGALMKDVQQPQAREFDTASFLAMGLVLVSYHGIAESLGAPNASASLLWSGGILVLAFAWFVVRELRFARVPFVDLRPLKIRAIGQGIAGCVLLGVVLGGSSAAVVYGVKIGHLAPIASVTIASSAFIGALLGSALVYGIWTKKLATNRVATIGGLVLLAALFAAQAALALVGPIAPLEAASLDVLEGFALALTIGPLASLLFDGAPHDQFGALALLFKIALVVGAAAAVPLLAAAASFSTIWFVFAALLLVVAVLVATG